MLARSPTAGAARARERRARQRAGVQWDLRVRTSTKRLVAALKALKAARGDAVGPLDTKAALEAELGEVIEAFCARWLGPEKKPHA
jgi:hypothetical protein